METLPDPNGYQGRKELDVVAGQSNFTTTKASAMIQYEIECLLPFQGCIISKCGWSFNRLPMIAGDVYDVDAKRKSKSWLSLL